MVHTCSLRTARGQGCKSEPSRVPPPVHTPSPGKRHTRHPDQRGTIIIRGRYQGRVQGRSPFTRSLVVKTLTIPSFFGRLRAGDIIQENDQVRDLPSTPRVMDGHARSPGQEYGQHPGHQAYTIRGEFRDPVKSNPFAVGPPISAAHLPAPPCLPAPASTLPPRQLRISYRPRQQVTETALGTTPGAAEETILQRHSRHAQTPAVPGEEETPTRGASTASLPGLAASCPPPGAKTLGYGHGDLTYVAPPMIPRAALSARRGYPASPLG